MNPIAVIFSILSLLVVLVIVLKKEKQINQASVVLALLAGVFSVAFVLPVLLDPEKGFSTYWCRVDGFSALLTALIAFIYVLATLVSIRYIGTEHREGVISIDDYKMYFALLPVFAICMLASVLTNNSVLLWIALEGTTLSSTFLVGLYKRKTSVEAAWKYILLCSTGISLGFVGTLLFSYGLNLGGANESIFTLTYMAEHASVIPLAIVKWAFVFTFIGFGVKVGFVPMHNWLPDAHSKAPSPISALFSGILLNVALYALIRFKFVSDIVMESSEWTGKLFLIFGVISIVFSALLIFVQQNYKRMLAYSSIEHMGLLSFALAFPPIGALASIMHMVGHALTKSMLFFGAGEILLKWKSTKVGKVKDVFKSSPFTATFFLLGILLIIALPPSVLFASEFLLFASSIAASFKISLLVLISLSVIAFAMLRLTMRMLFTGDEKQNEADAREIKKETWNITHTVMLVQLVVIVAFFFWVTSEGGLNFVDNIAKDFTYFVK